jgi:predicted delta-1-pyrroline-5-carboxylate dehydrogenase group 2
MEFRNQPPRRLFLERERAEFEAAIEAVRQEFGREYPLEIQGVEVRTDDRQQILNPSYPDGTCIGVVHLAGSAEVGRALLAAEDAQLAWAARPLSDRAAVLRRAAEILVQRQPIIAAWEVHEAAKAWGEALADVDEAIDYLRFYAKSAEEQNGIFARYRARGVVAVIPPWNFPAAIPCGMTSAALVMGNTVILKPAEQTPLVARQLVLALHDAGVPPDVLQWIPGRGEVAGAELVSSPRVDMVAFTGSAAVGQSIYKQGSRIAPRRGGLRTTLAEMGGKNAILVFPDADMDEAVVGVLRSAFGHANQKCSAASRVLIHRTVYSRLRDRLIDGASSLRRGPADEPGAFITPLIDAEARNRVVAATRQAAFEGKVLLPAAPEAVESNLLSPVLVEVPPDSAATAATTQREIFGPVLALIPFETEDQALAIANDTQYALTAGVYSRSPSTITRVSAGLDAGNVYVNRPTTGARVGVEPFGGHRLSGTGPKAGGPDYLWAFVTSKADWSEGVRLENGSTDFGAQLAPWKATPVARARAVAAAFDALANASYTEWEAATAFIGGTEGSIEAARHLLQQADEIVRPEPTTQLPGQQTYLRWDTPRGCGAVVAGAECPPRDLVAFVVAALLAGNGVAVVAARPVRSASGVLVRCLRAAGVPPTSLLLSGESINLDTLFRQPNVTFAAVRADLALARQVYELLANASAMPGSPWLKALITLADGPSVEESGFLRRFALPKTVAIRTLHLGADLELPITGE